MDEMGKKFDKTAKNNAVTYIMVIVAWLVMMALQQAGMLNSSTTGLLVPVCIYSIMAVSLNLTVGILGDLSLGQAGVMCVGAFASAFFTNLVQDSITFTPLRFTLAILIGALVAGAFGLLIGIPGKSNAFAISSKLGLAENIIEDAKGRLSERDVNFEDMLANLEQSRITIEKEQLEIQKYKAEIEDLKKKLTAKNERLDNSRDEILRKANEEAVQILKEAKDLADETIRNFNKYGQGQAPMSKMEKERSRVRDKMSASEKALSMKKKETVNHKVPKKLRIGDSVRVLSMNLKGTVHTLPNAKGDLYVQMGILRSLVNIKDLVLIDEDASPAAKKYGGTSSGKIKMSKAASVSTEINLIGMTVDEAIAHLDKYLDDAYVAHLPSVRIVHGKGTGALRNAVQTHLKNQRYVKSYRMGEPSEGGAGVTIAAFDV